MSGVGSSRCGLTVEGVHLGLGDGSTESEHKASVVMLQ
jgi:hypothetical protein